jgi:hypothetical protein
LDWQRIYDQKKFRWKPCSVTRMAENVFQRDGEVMTFWFAETAGGRQHKSRRRCPRPKLVIDLGLRLADIAGRKAKKKMVTLRSRQRGRMNRRRRGRPRQDERDQFLIDAAAAFRPGINAGKLVPAFCRTNRYLITLRTTLPGWRAL